MAPSAFLCALSAARNGSSAGVLCPNCAEENKDHLPVFVAQEFDYVRVDACDTCHTYIKSIDLSKNGNAVPVVDELATVSLNLWAQEHNYKRPSPTCSAFETLQASWLGPAAFARRHLGSARV